MRSLLTKEQNDILRSVTYSDIFSDREKNNQITQAFKIIIQKIRAPPSTPDYLGTLPRNIWTLREAIKKRLSFGHCPKGASTTPLILDIREVTFVSAHFGQP